MFTKKSTNTTNEDFDTIIDNCIVWKNDIGHLPGSKLKFKRDNDGELWLSAADDSNKSGDNDSVNSDNDNNDSISSDDDGIAQIRKKQKLLKDYLMESRKNQQQQQDITLCLRCFRSEFRENLFKNNRYCRQCSMIDPQMYRMYKSFNLNNEQQQDDDKVNQIRKQPESQNQNKENKKIRKRKLSNDFELSNDHQQESFQWQKYLDKYHLQSLNDKYFLLEQTIPFNLKNEFKCGMKLEGIDPLHPSKFCVLTVQKIQGYRLCLHFDGYSNRFNFWTNANSKQIFPVGFCKKTSRKLQYPPGMNEFNWNQYLSITNSIAAPENLFMINQIKIDQKFMEKFTINDKLEAVDIANSALICVATIRDILMDQILIHFDGWDDSFDYWTSIRSPLIHPINWCKSKSKCLTPPNGYHRKEFSWTEYLKETNSRPVPEQAFINEDNNYQQLMFNYWKQGMRLEAVDKRNPQFIRVASIVQHQQHSVIIHYDGWDEKYDCIFDEDSPDLHPMNWCQKTGHRLEQPPNKYLSKLKTLCPVPGCNGDGHLKWYKYSIHSNEKDCPYSKYNYDLERLENYDRFNDLIVSDSDDGDDFDKNDDDQIIISQNINPYYLKLIKENYLEMKSILKTNNIHTIKYLMNYVKTFNYYPLDLIKFNTEQIYRIIMDITDNVDVAKIFLNEKIDGTTFLCLRHDDLINRLKIDINSTIKIVPYIFANLKFLFKDGF